MGLWCKMARLRLEAGEVGKVTLTELADGTWRARCRYRGEADGKLRSIQRERRSKTAAERACRAAATDAAKANHDELNKESRLSELVASWWETIEVRHQSGELATSTVDNYRRTRDRVTTGIGELRVRECTATRLGAWVKSEAGEHPSVHRDLRRLLSDVFTHGMSIDVVSKNPGAAITKAPTKRKDTDALTAADVMRLRALVHAYEQDGANRIKTNGKRAGGRPRALYLADVVEVLLGTGLRIGEVLGLRWQDVDLMASPPTVTVNGALKTRKADPAKGVSSLYWEPRPKSRTSRRTISLPNFAVEVLLRLHVDNDQGIEWVFPSEHGTPRFPANVRAALRKACGHDLDGLTPHTIRRTVATIVEAGLDVRTASMLLGHSEVAVTERAYVRRGRVAPDTSAVLEGVLTPFGNENGE